MTKVDFIRQAAKNQGNSITETRYWVNLVLDELKKALIDEDEVNLYGLGTFSHKVHKGHVVKAFDGTKILCPDSTLLSFAPSIYLKAAVKDQITSKEFEKRMDKLRAYKRGEYIPGVYLGEGRLNTFDIKTGERHRRDDIEILEEAPATDETDDK